MKNALLSSAVLMLTFSLTGSAQIHAKEDAQILRIGIPVYPNLAVHLGLEEEIIGTLTLGRDGHVVSVNFDRGDKNFHMVINDAIKEWLFTKSLKKARKLRIIFGFRLLPYGSDSYTSSVFIAPNKIEVFAKRVKVLE